MNARTSLLFCLLLAAPQAAHASPAISCHCFRDRAYDPAAPAAADPYILATTQNSVLAVAFGLEKKELVRAKMTGTPGEDLWVAHAVAARTGLRAADLLDARGRAASWAEALTGQGVGAGRVGEPLAPLLARGAPDAAVASAVVDSVATGRLALGAEAARALRAVGASDPELIAAAVLARLTGRGAPELLAAVRAGEASWGGLLHGAGVAADDMEATARKYLK